MLRIAVRYLGREWQLCNSAYADGTINTLTNRLGDKRPVFPCAPGRAVRALSEAVPLSCCRAHSRYRSFSTRITSASASVTMFAPIIGQEPIIRP